MIDHSLEIKIADRGEPTSHVVLYQPEIPQNTGNIGRTCVATGSKLWIVRPIPFQIDEKAVRRAGLDYWTHLNLQITDDWDQLRQALPESDQRRYWYFSRWAKRPCWDAIFNRGDVLVFGSETSGLPESIRQSAGQRALRLPTTAEVRSLNLSNTVAIAVYELLRQLNQALPRT
jgi:tRNA (cytidine/uridine-2'-O-)-methyltransferase